MRPGDAITELTAEGDVKVVFSAPERYVSVLAPGTRVDIRSVAYPGSSIEGRVSLVEPVVDPATRNVRVVARVPNDGERMRAGMSADVTVVLASRPGAVTVPSEAVFAEGDRLLVYLVKADATVARTEVKLGSRLPDVVEVLDGLHPGDVVVRAGHQKLFDGAKVAPAAVKGSPAAEEKPGGGDAAQ
ncbi:MAG: efflux RND transporter periplasmic adaptor subunit [Acidobacteriota bacterium]